MNTGLNHVKPPADAGVVPPSFVGNLTNNPSLRRRIDEETRSRPTRRILRGAFVLAAIAAAFGQAGAAELVHPIADI